jgi:hypothetical protein
MTVLATVQDEPVTHGDRITAERLWALDRTTSEQLLDVLTKAGFLLRNQKGAYLRATVA